MQYAVRHLRELEEEAKAGVDRQTELYENIRAARLRAEAIAGEPVNGENGSGNSGGNVIIGPWAAAVAAAGIAGKILFGSRRAVTTTTAAALATGGIGLAIIHTPHDPPSHGALPARPPVTAPPGVRSFPAPQPRTSPPAPAAPDRPVSAPARAASPHRHRPRSSGTVEVVHSPVLSGAPAVDTSPTGLPITVAPTTPGAPATKRRCLADVRPALPIAALCWPKS